MKVLVFKNGEVGEVQEISLVTDLFPEGAELQEVGLFCNTVLLYYCPNTKGGSSKTLHFNDVTRATQEITGTFVLTPRIGGDLCNAQIELLMVGFEGKSDVTISNFPLPYDDGTQEGLEGFLKVLIVSPQRMPSMELIPNTLEAMQAVVGGYIQAVYPFDEPELALVCCEDGKVQGLPLNRALRKRDGTPYDVVSGTFFVCGMGEEDFDSLPDEYIKKVKDRFLIPESFQFIKKETGTKIKVRPMVD